MDAATLQKVHPQRFHKAFLDKRVRHDGRVIMQPRPCSVACGVLSSADASASTQLGNTSALCGIQAVATKVPDQSIDNLSDAQAHIFLVSSASASLGLASTLDRKHVTDWTQLKINDQGWTWKLYIDVMCLNDDGNLFDAACTAVCAALWSLDLRVVELGESNEIRMTDAPPVRFRMASTPVPVSVASVLGELVVDPTNAEEKIATATVSAVAIDSNQVIVQFTHGTEASKPSAVLGVSALAGQRWSAMHGDIEVAAEEARARTRAR